VKKRILAYAIIILSVVYFYSSESIASNADHSIFHPFCIEEFVEDEWEKPFDMKECSSRNPIDDLKPVENAPKPTYYADRLDHIENGAGWSGYVQYTIAGHLKNIYDIEYVFSGGGSGSFYRVFTMKLNNDGTTEMLGYVPFGDRCNDGVAKFEKSFAAGDSQVIISSAATPFRLLNADNRYEWRRAGWAKVMMKANPNADPQEIIKELKAPELHNGWSPYQDIANSAVSCVGRIHWKFDETVSEWFPIKVQFAEDALDDVSDKKQINQCLAAWKEKYSNQFGSLTEDNMYEVSGPKWLELISKVPEVCEKGNGLMGWLESRY